MPGLLAPDNQRILGCDDDVDDIEDLIVSDLPNQRARNKPDVVPRARKSRKPGGQRQNNQHIVGSDTAETGWHLDSYVPGYFSYTFMN